MTRTLIRFDAAIRSARDRALRALREEKGEVNIVATVLLIVIAVALLVLFNQQITGWITSMFDKINSGIEGIG